MLTALRRFVADPSGRQPGGQLRMGRAGLLAGFVEYISRRGIPNRKCGSPGKRARERMRTATTVKYLDCVIFVTGMSISMAFLKVRMEETRMQIYVIEARFMSVVWIISPIQAATYE
jgi:hypothetical protein